MKRALYLGKFLNSIFGQIAFLSFAFVFAFVYFMVLQPFLNSQPDSRTPLEKSDGYIARDISEYFHRKRSQKQEVADSLEQMPHIKQALLTNPDFKYYVMQGNYIYSNSDISNARKERILESMRIVENYSNDDRACFRWNVREGLNVEEQRVRGRFSFCFGELQYYEFSGITVPLEREDYLNDWIPTWIWNTSREVVYVFLGILIICILIFVYNLRAIKKVTSIASKLKEDIPKDPLPLKGLPLEVLPLVRAINKLVNNVQSAQERHHFFLSAAAHEMRTPLTLLRAQINLLPSGEDKDELTKATINIINLVNQLLHLMKMEDVIPLRQKVNISSSVKNVIVDRASLFLDKEVEVEFIDESPDLEIDGDRELLEVAIANLVENAVSFSPIGKKVEVRLSSNSQLSISDAGPGISAQQIDSVFEPFTKFPPNRDGHGLGLAIVAAIVRLHGATIIAENRDSGGANFTVNFRENNR